jgi:hypothetical protein
MELLEMPPITPSLTIRQSRMEVCGVKVYKIRRSDGVDAPRISKRRRIMRRWVQNSV